MYDLLGILCVSPGGLLFWCKNLKGYTHIWENFAPPRGCMCAYGLRFVTN